MKKKTKENKKNRKWGEGEKGEVRFYLVPCSTK